MRYSSALVLGTLLAGQATAHPARHAAFHARREAEAAKRDLKDVNWATVAYDLSNVDWDKVDWASVFNKPAKATPAPDSPAPAAPAAAQVTPASTPNEDNASEPAPPAPPAPAPSPAPTQAPTSSEPAIKDDSNDDNKPSDPIGDIVNDITTGLESFVKKLGISAPGVNSKTANGGIWLGESKWQAKFVNGASTGQYAVCWQSKGFTGMSLNVNKPDISIYLAPGASQTVSFGENVPAACAFADDNTKLANFGGLDETWWEVTFGQTGAFDVSRNVNMNGKNISSEGSKCKSDMNTCVFKCTGNVDSCEKGYELFNCDSGNGGGGGYDPIMQGTGGGCAMNSEGESVTVTVS